MICLLEVNSDLCGLWKNSYGVPFLCHKLNLTYYLDKKRPQVELEILDYGIEGEETR